MARLLALVAAVAMVAGSLALRARLDEDGTAGGGGGDDVPRLVCATELAAACQMLSNDGSEVLAETTVESAGVTADRLAGLGGGDAGLDAWLVPAPWPQMVDALRRAGGRDPLFDDVSAPLARSPLVIVAWPDRAEPLAGSCPGGPVGWRCLGDAAPRNWTDVGGRSEWGRVKVGLPRPDREAAGLAVAGAAAVAYLGRSDLDELDLRGEFSGWFATLQRVAERPAAGSPLTGMLVRGKAALDAVATLEAEALPALANVPQAPGVIYPEPVTTADVVLGSVGGGRGRRAIDLLDRTGPAALGRTGWRVAGSTATPALPPADGLPPVPSLLALRALAAEVAP